MADRIRVTSDMVRSIPRAGSPYQHAAEEVVRERLPSGDFEERGAVVRPDYRLGVAAGGDHEIGDSVAVQVRGGNAEAAADWAVPHQLPFERPGVGAVDQDAAVSGGRGGDDDVGHAVAID